jgi:hypothetical protein
MKKIYTSWKKYKKMIEGEYYKGFHVKINPVAKYSGSFLISYRYTLEKENSEYDIKNGKLGIKTVYPIKLSTNKIFKGFNNYGFDQRYQLTKKEFIPQLKRLVDQIGK